MWKIFLNLTKFSPFKFFVWRHTALIHTLNESLWFVNWHYCRCFLENICIFWTILLLSRFRKKEKKELEVKKYREMKEEIQLAERWDSGYNRREGIFSTRKEIWCCASNHRKRKSYKSLEGKQNRHIKKPGMNINSNTEMPKKREWTYKFWMPIWTPKVLKKWVCVWNTQNT